MQIDQSLIYIVIIIFSVLMILLIGLIFAFYMMMKRYLDLKEGRDKYPDPKVLLLRAHAKSQKIIEDATEKADKIIASTQDLKTNDLDAIQEKIQEAQKENFQIYKSSVSRIQDESMRLLQNVPEYIKALLSKEIFAVRDELVKEIRVAHDNAKDLITQAYKQADDEVGVYKKVRMDALDKTIISIVQQISRKVLNKEIDPTEHEKLVMRALQEAKRQNIFSEGGVLDQDNLNQENPTRANSNQDNEEKNESEV